MKQKKFTRRLVFCGMFSALAFVIYLFDFPVIPGMQYLKIDLSDIPAVVAGIFLGPAAGVVVEFVKNVIDLAVRGLGSTLGFGDLMNFIVGAALVVPISAILRSFLRRDGNRYKGAAAAAAAGFAVMVAAGIAGNYIIAPPYFRFALNVTVTGKILWAAIASATILNIIKALIVGILLFPFVKSSWELIRKKAIL